MEGVGDFQEKKIKPSAEEMAIIMQRYIMPAIGAYDAVNSTPSSMDYPYSRVLE